MNLMELNDYFRRDAGKSPLMGLLDDSGYSLAQPEVGRAPEPAAPNFDFSPNEKQNKQALFSSLASMGAAMLANNRGNFGQSFGHGLAAQQQGYRGALDRASDENVQQFRTGMLKDDWQAKQQERQRQAALRTALGQIDWTQKDAYQKAAGLVAQTGDFEAAAVARKAGGELSDKLGAPVIGINPATGKREYVQWGQDGQWGWSGISAPEEIVQMDAGGRVLLRPKYSSEPVATIDKTQSPDSVASTGSNAQKAEIDFTQDFNKQKTAYGVVTQARNNVLNSIKQNNAAGDLAAATAIMKMLDPGSVVRESELAMAMNATGAFDRIGNYMQHLQNGQRLNPQQRTDFINLANALFKTADEQMLNTARDYDKRSREYGFNPELVLGGDFHRRLYPAQQQQPVQRQVAPKAAQQAPTKAQVFGSTFSRSQIAELATKTGKTVQQVEQQLKAGGVRVQ